MCKKNIFQILLLFAIEMAVLSVFWQKKGLGPLGIKVFCPYNRKYSFEWFLIE